MKEKNLLVIKFGTASITRPSGEPDINILKDIAAQVAILHADHHVVIVSSGAVGAGKNFIRNYEGTISQKKAAASVGNPLLLKMYDEVFGLHGIKVAQSLLERQHFSNRQQFLQLKETYEELWSNGIIPIANENDVVSNRELKFSDNDELATLIASGFGAAYLLLCTVSGGLLDAEGKLIEKIDEIDQNILGFVNNKKSALGSGGMASKLTFTKLATQMGIKVVIFGMKTENGLLKAYEGTAGTNFTAKPNKVKAKDKWMASSGISVGKVYIDEGAAKAVLARKSLLAVGVKSFEGSFTKGELIEIYKENQELLGVGKSKVNTEDLSQKEGLVVVHADDIVLL